MPKNDGKTVEQRFHERYTVDPVTGCWNWTAGLNGKGYAYIWTGPKRKGDTKQAYKFGWELVHGPVPGKLELHHTCENARCVNPGHLELKTRIEHKQEHSRLQTHCKRDHEFTTENTFINKRGARVCRTCSREASARDREDPIKRAAKRDASRRFGKTQKRKDYLREWRSKQKLKH